MYTKCFLVSTKDLCMHMCKKIQQMIIIVSSNNPIVDVLRPTQKTPGMKYVYTCRICILILYQSKG